MDFLCRFADCQLDFNRILQQCFGKFLYLFRHGSREHDRLAGCRQLLGNGHDILGKSHVKHTVSLVKDEEAHLGEIDIAKRDMGNETSRRCDDDIGSERQALQLLIVAVAVVAAIDSNA